MRKYTKDGEFFLDEQGLTWNVEEDIFMDELGFCCCGSPIEVLELIEDNLEYAKSDDKDYKTRTIKDDFILYFLDSIKLVDHGSSILFPYLTDKGEEYLEKLSEFFKRYDKEAK